jgi:hypothetical protein
MDGLLVGPQQQLTITRTRYGHCFAVQFDDTLKYLKKETACVCNDNILGVKTLKKHKKNKIVAVCSSGGIVD